MFFEAAQHVVNTLGRADDEPCLVNHLTDQVVNDLLFGLFVEIDQNISQEDAVKRGSIERLNKIVTLELDKVSQDGPHLPTLVLRLNEVSFAAFLGEFCNRTCVVLPMPGFLDGFGTDIRAKDLHLPIFESKFVLDQTQR